MSRLSDSETDHNVDEKFVNVDDNVKNTREKYLLMPLDEKRQKYACGKNYVTLSKIDKWSDHYKTNFESLCRLNKKKSVKYDVDELLNSKVSLWTGDITKLEIDAIVNAANKSLLGGGGVDGAIHSAASNLLYKECKLLGGCNTGDAKTTCGYKLPAKYVIHTVGPRDRSESKLRSCYKSCFGELDKLKLKSIAFCCISTGIYGYPNSEAVHVALDETRKYLMSLKEDGKISSFERVVFCLFLDVDVKLYQREMQNYFPAENQPEDDSQKNETLNNSNSSASSPKSSSSGGHSVSSHTSSSVEITGDEVVKNDDGDTREKMKDVFDDNEESTSDACQIGEKDDDDDDAKVCPDSNDGDGVDHEISKIEKIN